VLRELPYAVLKSTTAPFKLARDVRANGVEAGFLHSAAVRAFVHYSMLVHYTHALYSYIILMYCVL
jgi:hypothetical protein